MSEKLLTSELLGVDITIVKKEFVIDHIVNQIKSSDKKFYILTPNPEIIVLAQKNNEFKAILNKAKFCIPDGIGVVLAFKFLKKIKIERLTGVDMMEEICSRLSKQHGIVGFLGGKNGVAEKTANRLSKKYPGLRIGYVEEEWDNKKYKLQMSNYKTEKIDLLFVAFGFPKQEEWIAKNLDNIPVKSAMAVGGSFDYLSGRVMRAPFLIRKMGFEWLFRLLRQPWRWRRQLALLKFILLVLNEKVKLRK